MRRIFLLIMSLIFIAYSSWEQNEFLIGGFLDPPLTGNRAKDIKIMEQVHDAGINVLSGIGWFTAKNEEMKYRLEVLTHVPGLKTYVSDKNNDGHKVYGKGVYDSTVTQSLINFFRGLTPRLRRQMYGYFVCDEPHYNKELENGIMKIRHFQKSLMEGGDPEKHAWINLFSNRTRDFWDNYPKNPKKKPHPWKCSYNDKQYRNYLRDVIKGGAKVICFDNYCFLTNAYYSSLPSTQIRPYFFRNYQIAAEESQKAGIPFWAMANCVEHVLFSARDKKGRHVPVIEADGPADYRTGSKLGSFTNIPEGQLRFSAHVPILYGAKGIWWFLYYHKQTPGGKNHWYYSKEALVDQNGMSTKIYPVIQKINRRLVDLGPILMNLKWVGTYHGSAKNSMPTTTDDPANDFLGIPESGLPVISSNTPVIESIAGKDKRHCAVGLFSVHEMPYYYLIVMNKSINSVSSFTLIFKKGIKSILVNKKELVGNQKEEEKRKSLSLEINPGEIEIVKVTQW